MSQNYWLFGTGVNILVDELKSNGNYDLIEGTFGSSVETPLHAHGEYDEAIYVIEGEFTVYMPGVTIKAAAGDNIFIPKSTPHAVVSGIDSVNKALTVASPSGFAKLIRNVGTPNTGSGIPAQEPDVLERFLEYSEALGDIILGPPGSRP